MIFSILLFSNEMYKKNAFLIINKIQKFYINLIYFYFPETGIRLLL